jgi:oxygen-independent coproporphyrinogen-3 oxidase
MQLSLDLMCGVSGQTMSSWLETVDRAIATGAGHMSVYPLSIESGTPLAQAIECGESPEPDPDLAADMMLAADERLGSAGIRRYEVANFARVGEESRHNMRYWTGGEYLGLGPGAASMLRAETLARVDVMGEVVRERGVQDDTRVRFVVNDTFEDFVLQGFDRWPAQVEFLTPSEAAREDVMLGLRLVAGVSAERIAAAGLEVVMRRLRDDGLVEESAGDWRTTRRGWLLGNEVFGAVWSTPNQ